MRIPVSMTSTIRGMIDRANKEVKLMEKAGFLRFPDVAKRPLPMPRFVAVAPDSYIVPAVSMYVDEFLEQVLRDEICI